MQLHEPQDKIVQIKNISTDCNCGKKEMKPIHASGRSANGSSVSWRSGEAAVDVLEAVPFMAPDVILPSSFYLKLSHEAANSLASAMAQN